MRKVLQPISYIYIKMLLVNGIKTMVFIFLK